MLKKQREKSPSAHRKTVSVNGASARKRAREGGSVFTLEAYHAAVREVFTRVRGAYSVVGYIAGHGLFAFRDPYGIKPISMGRRRANGKDAYAVASGRTRITRLIKAIDRAITVIVETVAELG